MSLPSPPADPLSNQPRALRPAYATGMLLDARDFSDEQTYHRGRLARALVFLAGGGTLAGLGLSHVPEASGQVESLRVDPGLAVDRLGRLVEIPRAACIRLPRWWTGQDAATLVQASYADPARFVSRRLADSAPVLPARALVADVFVRFAACPVGLSPSFASGPYDSLDAVATARLCDAYELRLVARTGLDDSYTGLPPPPGAAAVGDAGASAAARRDAMQDAILAAYPGAYQGDGQALPPAPEQPDDIDPSAVFLGRLFLPVDAGDPPGRTTDAPVTDNWGRRFLPPQALLAQWHGL
ncbi:MAG TPA: hypothetical protein PKH69_02895 [Thiobacillaceae bacterium]|nr:hypothetical protein [Thiobacillaceae bacterium]HNU63034.1 hypothetical protein [Thiobacillaceae bacterium]